MSRRELEVENMETIDEVEFFADEVFSFVLNECCYLRCPKNTGDDDSGSMFSSSIRWAVRYYLQKYEEDTKNIFNTLLGHGNLNAHFRVFSRNMTKEIFLRGYKPQEFVQFCTIMSRLGVLCYTSHFRDSMACAIQTIVDVVRLFVKTGQFTANTWTELTKEILIV